MFDRERRVHDAIDVSTRSVELRGRDVDGRARPGQAVIASDRGTLDRQIARWTMDASLVTDRPDALPWTTGGRSPMAIHHPNRGYR